MNALKTLLPVAALAAGLVISGGASAATIAFSYWVDQPADAMDATLANIALLGAASGTGTVGALDFSTNDSDHTTINTWLGVSTPNGTHLLDNTVFLFTGSTLLHAGINNYTISHDDGVQLHVDGALPNFPVDAPSPTAPEVTAFTIIVPTTGVYNFELAYGECCTGPAVLDIETGPGATTFGSTTPEPATWGLMIMGFGGIGAMVRRRRQAVALTA